MAEACASLKLKRSIMACLAKSGVLGCPDDVDDLVDVVLRDEQTQHDMQPLLGLGQIEARAPHDHVVAVLDEMPHQIAAD